ncbi:hypothetical protein OPQ81_000524 [Rhizoctonia solani]|nr:hypothetical protein OPQ81_000524 [Rhizoctonia solani]
MTIRKWDALSGRSALAPLIGHTDAVSCIAISSDDTRIVSGSHDATICVWDLQSGDLVMGPLTGHKNPIRVVTLSPDDARIASISSDGILIIWDSQTGQTLLTPLPDQRVGTSSVSFSPDGAFIVSTYDTGTVRIWDAVSWKLISEIGPFFKPIGRTFSTFSPDGTYIFFGTEYGEILLLDVHRSVVLEPLPGHNGRITSIDFSPSGRYLVSGSSDESLYVCNLTKGELVAGLLLGHTQGVNMVRYSKDGSRIVSCSGDGTIRQWDAESGISSSNPIDVTSGGLDGVTMATYSPDGTRILSITALKGLSIWNSNTGQLILAPTIAGILIPVHAEFSPDGTTIMAIDMGGSIYLWDAQNGQLVSSHLCDQYLDSYSVAFSLGGLYCAYYNYSGRRRIFLRKIKTGEHTSWNFEGHTHIVNSTCFSPDNTRIVSGSEDTTV